MGVISGQSRRLSRSSNRRFVRNRLICEGPDCCASDDCGAGADRFRNEASEAGTRRLLLRVCEEIAAADMVRKCRAGACREGGRFGVLGLREGGLESWGRVNKGQGSVCWGTRLRERLGLA